MKERRPIFYDEERVRWRRTRRVLEISAVALTLLLAYFFVTIAVSVELPAGLLPSTNPGLHALKLKKKPAPVREGRQRRVSHLGTVPATYDPLRAAFFVSWDPNSLASLRKHYKELDLLLPEQLHAVTPDGAITIVDYEHGQRTAKCTPAEAVAILKDDKLHQWMKSTFVDQPAIPMIGLLNNYDGVSWHIKEMAEMLGSAAARHKLSQDLVQFAQQAHEAGVLVDFEEVPDASQKNYREFAAELASGMHAASLKLMIALPARDDAYDYEFFGKQADAIVLMNYDEHWLTSPPGPIASQDWFVENLRQVLEEVPAQKIVVTVGNYAYDWTVTDKNKPVTSETLTIQEALLHAYESEAPVEFDAASLNPHYSYSDEQNHIHQVWMLDAVTAYNQLRASERLGVQGTAMWRLGSADTSVWPIWDATRPDDAARNKLTDLPPGPDLILEGSGDIWHFVDTPKDGKRSFTYDPNTDLFTSEKYDAYPRSYNIDQIGAANKKIALTFDDGPDPRWTPKILDILKREQVPATFFVIGLDGNQYPELLRREYAEGHEIGNHTYTHPAWDEISKTQARWELNLTQRLIESTLGVKTILFRPPYGIDHQPEYAEEVSQLPFAQDMGYLIIGQKIDPHDWQLVNGKPNPAQEIVDQVLQQANDGNIILFHDGGGDRTQTIAALPQVIDTLRARGYSFVSVPDLLGKTRAQVMLPLSSQEQLEARADGFIFGIYHWFRVGIATVFMAGIVLVSGRALVIGILALIEKCRPDHHILSDPPPTVSVL
ncbi:MAG TPA: polysaccharide deacetylase family protein, partial [Candidatus Acidoferrum sp.]|nr:polysaccharide deacetylase family protein [Candidatus Acidoferrum sp.]